MKRRDFKRLRDAEIARAASEIKAASVKKKRWDEVAGIRGNSPKPRRAGNATHQTRARAHAGERRLRNTNSCEEFTAPQLPLLLTEPSG